jgi:hypothetical protein
MDAIPEAVSLAELQPLASKTTLARFAVVLVAIAILFWRTPSTFTNPQFWGEDIYFFYGARVHGWTSITTLLAGYAMCVQYLVAILASYFSPVSAPTIYNYAAVFLTLIVCWLVTSPRLDMPAKPLLAVAVVIVPTAREEVGTLCNIQWILPIGAFALLFMSASKSKAVTAAEAIFAASMALSGPFSIFLAPMFAWQTYFARNRADRNRFLLLTATVGFGAVVQLMLIGTQPYSIGHNVAAPYPKTLWINIPFAHFVTTFSVPAKIFQNGTGAAIGASCLLIAVALACVPPYRTQKILMLLFASLIAVSGMHKLGDGLASQAAAQRYYYVGAVFSLWFICCISKEINLRRLILGAVVLIDVSLLRAILNTPRANENLEWPVWARYISSGLPMVIPTSPPGWYLGLSASKDGPLARFAPWIGHNINELAKIDATACAGFLDSFKIHPPTPPWFLGLPRVPRTTQSNRYRSSPLPINWAQFLALVFLGLRR